MAKKKKAKSSSPSKSNQSKQPKAAAAAPAPIETPASAVQHPSTPTPTPADSVVLASLEETGPLIISDLPISISEEPAVGEETPTQLSDKDTQSTRKVAKTLLETDTSSLKDAIEAAEAQSSRKVAKTLLEADLKPTDLDASAPPAPPAPPAPVAPPSTVEEPPVEDVKPSRKVAKTLLEFSPDIADAVVAASQNPVADVAPDSDEKAKRKVAKTLLDVSVEDLSELANSISMEEEVEEIEAVDIAPTPPSPAEPSGRRVAKTMLEVNISDLNDFAKALADEDVPEPALAVVPDVAPTVVEIPSTEESKIPAQRSQRVARTMLEISRVGLIRSDIPVVEAPSVSDAPQPKKINRTLSSHVLNNFSFDQLCPEDSDEDTTRTQSSVGVDAGAASLEQQSSFEPPSAEETQGNSEQFDASEMMWPGDEEKAQELQEGGERKPERFIAKTMIDHNFILATLNVSLEKKQERVAEKLAEKALEPPKPSFPIENFKTAEAGCPWAWDEFDSPKDKVKYCGKCNAIVYNFQGMEMPEAEAMIFKRENREKFTLYKRQDGKFMTQDCPEALKQKKGKMMMILVAVIAVLLIAASFFLAPAPAPAPKQETAPTASDDSVPPADGQGVSRPPKGTGVHDSSSSSGAFHYEAGKGVTTPPTVQPAYDPYQAQPTAPSVSPGYDEKGDFWIRTDQPNNQR